MKLADSIPWQKVENPCNVQFNATVGGHAKLFLVVFGPLFKKNRLGLTDEETVLKIQDNTQMQSFGFACYSSKALFDPSMMVHLWTRFTVDDLKKN